MAKVIFGESIDAITGKIGGSVFQYSLGGSQVRSRVSPRNPRFTTQQVPKGTFGYHSGIWRSLSDTQRDSFHDAPGFGISDFNKFVRCQTFLSSAGQPIVTDYVAGTEPPVIPADQNIMNPVQQTIDLLGATPEIPAGHTLCIYMSLLRKPSQNYSSRARKILITTLPALTPIPGTYDITTNFLARLGSPEPGALQDLLVILVNNANGDNSADSINQVTVQPLP